VRSTRVVGSRESYEVQIKNAARHLGFTLVGITTADRPQTFDTYKNWIGDRKHAGMGYLATERNLERRQDPKKILPDCQSIIVTATPYLPEHQFPSTLEAEVQVAAYALGEDYHQVITSRLVELLTLVERIAGHPINSKVYADTGPILERDLAQRAGLGWIGKNTCLINPEQGSYFLLGEILLDLPLRPDPPFEPDRCGTCTRCLEACPTRCILPDRTIDASRCISYLTIEEKGDIDSTYRSEIGKWIFGCDICQQVCPWNIRFAQPTQDDTFQPREVLKDPDLGTFLNLEAGSWLENLRGSPLERPRRKGLLRNAAVVAGNIRSSKHIKKLSRILHLDPEPLVRGHSAWALGKIRGPEAVVALRTALQSEQNPDVIAEIKNAIHGGD
jgi:epoxyqueuosine reductase